MHTVSLLHVRIHDLTKKQAYEKLEEFFISSKPHLIVTPNPEILLHARTDLQYQHILNTADLALADGAGLILCSSLRERIPGVDIAEYLLSVADKRRLRVSCVVRQDGRSSAAEVEQAIQKKFPNAHVKTVALQKAAWKNASTIYTLIEQQPDIIFVGLGFPEQEYWLSTYLQDIPSVKIGIAVGGAFDFWTGVAKRAPVWIQRLKLEWLWRVCTEPRRIRRIVRAVVFFPLIVLYERIKK